MIRIPTDGELAILKVLWRDGPATVRQIHDGLEQATAYTTTLKILQIMHDKGLVTRDTSERSHVYAAAVAEEETQGSLLRSLADRAFDGSASAMVMRALSSEKTSKKELAQIRALLDELEEGRGGKR
ncbi:MAG: BlaI/MecI/CopY family transcriptional regulator [Polyangiaceae bacterium]